MSFEEIANSDVTRKKKEITISHNEKKYKFFANELTYPQRLHLAVMQSMGSEHFAQLVVYSITDEAGKNMSLEQVNKLSDEHFSEFFVASNEVNKKEDEKN